MGWWLSWRFGKKNCFSEKDVLRPKYTKIWNFDDIWAPSTWRGQGHVAKGPFCAILLLQITIMSGGKCKAIHNSFRDTLYHTVEEDDLVTSSDVNHFPQQPAYIVTVYWLLVLRDHWHLFSAVRWNSKVFSLYFDLYCIMFVLSDELYCFSQRVFQVETVMTPWAPVMWLYILQTTLGC